MKAMVLTRISDLAVSDKPLELRELPDPAPQHGQLLIDVLACGVCHTEIDEIEGRTPPATYPVIPGHQVVGRVRIPAGTFVAGDRVGVGWIFSACGKCAFCRRGLENLCPYFRATGRDADGGYAGAMIVSPEYAYAIPAAFTDAEAAPLLCAGAIGYRSLRLSLLENCQSLGLMGFGASAHLVLKMSQFKFPAARVYVFARSESERKFALELGATWAGAMEEEPPEKLTAIIDTTPVWTPVLQSLECLLPGGRLVINAIRKEKNDLNNLTHLDYARHLWMEKEIKSVANVARSDILEFLSLAASIPIKPEYQEYALQDANRALTDLKQRKIRGAKVLVIR